MKRIYKAARQCGYLQNLMEPLDPRDAKKITKIKFYIYVQVVKENPWAQ